MEKTKILITGSLGFIYGNFIRRVLFDRHHWKIYSVDKVDQVIDLVDVYYNKEHQFFVGDVSDDRTMDRIFEFVKPDIVIHAAAETHVDTSLSEPYKFITSNVLGTQVIINKCLKYQIKKLIHISTDEVYGSLSATDEAWNEKASINPRNTYSATKASAEHLILSANNAFGLPYLIVRPSNTYGKRQRPTKLIPKTIKSIINNQPIPIYGKGEQIRDWLFVEDHIAGIVKLIYENITNQIFNLAPNREMSNLEMVKLICKLMNKGEDLITFIPDPRNNAHDFRYSCDSSKIRNLGWKPKVSLEESLKETIDWYLLNQYYLRS